MNLGRYVASCVKKRNWFSLDNLQELPIIKELSINKTEEDYSLYLGLLTYIHHTWLEEIPKILKFIWFFTYCQMIFQTIRATL